MLRMELMLICYAYLIPLSVLADSNVLPDPELITVEFINQVSLAYALHAL